MSEKPGRYQRSTGGLVGAPIVVTATEMESTDQVMPVAGLQAFLAVHVQQGFAQGHPGLGLIIVPVQCKEALVPGSGVFCILAAFFRHSFGRIQLMAQRVFIDEMNLLVT